MPSSFEELVAFYDIRSAPDTRMRLAEIASEYSLRAKQFGYVPLVGAATPEGLMSFLRLSVDHSGRIDESKLPGDLIEAFRVRFPNVHGHEDIGSLTPDSAQKFVEGWCRKFIEILVRDALNSRKTVGAS